MAMSRRPDSVLWMNPSSWPTQQAALALALDWPAPPRQAARANCDSINARPASVVVVVVGVVIQTNPLGRLDNQSVANVERNAIWPAGHSGACSWRANFGFDSTRRRPGQTSVANGLGAALPAAAAAANTNAEIPAARYGALRNADLGSRSLRAPAKARRIRSVSRPATGELGCY